MGPAVFTAGEKLLAQLGHGDVSASMGPAVFTAGEHAALSESYRRVWLQWGPRFSPRERGDGRDCGGRAGVASMGPAVFTAGEQHVVERGHGAGSRASMGPAVFTAGESSTRSSCRLRSSRFNGARGFHRGRVAAASSACCRWYMLQWGPRFSPRERARARAYATTGHDASMGPAVFTAGETWPAAKTPCLMRLQWGPRFSPRESGHRP